MDKTAQLLDAHARIKVLESDLSAYKSEISRRREDYDSLLQEREAIKQRLIDLETANDPPAIGPDGIRWSLHSYFDSFMLRKEEPDLSVEVRRLTLDDLKSIFQGDYMHLAQNMRPAFCKCYLSETCLQGLIQCAGDCLREVSQRVEKSVPLSSDVHIELPRLSMRSLCSRCGSPLNDSGDCTNCYLPF